MSVSSDEIEDEDQNLTDDIPHFKKKRPGKNSSTARKKNSMLPAIGVIEEESDESPSQSKS